MINIKGMRTTGAILWTTVSFGFLLSHTLSAKHFFPCSPEELEVAIIQANVNCEDDVIDLQCNQFDLTTSDNSTPTNGSNGLPVIGPDSGHKLKIKNGAIIRDQGSPAFRFFEIQPDAFLILESITLENGVVVTGSGLAVSGGAILNQGALELIDSTIAGFIPPNTVQFNARLGGGLYNDTGATTKIIGSSFFGLQAVNGGAIYNVENIPEICSSRFLRNVANGGTQVFGAGLGGALFNHDGASIGIIRRSIFDQNQATGGSLSGQGGAIYNEGSTNPSATIGTISFTTFSSNAANTAGAVFNVGNISIITASTFLDNRTTSGNFAGGGAILNGTSLTANIGTISNSTFSANSSISNGGAIANSSTIGAFTNNTVSLNHSDSTGGGVFNNQVMLNFISNIVGGNSATVAANDIAAAGSSSFGTPSYNLVGDGGDSAFDNVCNIFLSANHNLIGNCPQSTPFIIDPLLESLANNGGPTLTHALRPLSPAIGNGFNPAPHILKFDQRGPGHPRTIDGSTDIGSYESCVDFDLDGDCDDDNCQCEDDDHDGECDNEHQQ